MRSVTTSIPVKHYKELTRLARVEGSKVAPLVREAVADLLVKYKDKIPPEKPLPGQTHLDFIIVDEAGPPSDRE